MNKHNSLSLSLSPLFLANALKINNIIDNNNNSNGYPSYNKKKSALVKITKGNALSKKKKIALKKKHDKNKTMQSGKMRTGKAKRKALRNSRRAEQNKIDDAIRKSKENGGVDEKDVEMKDFD